FASHWSCKVNEEEPLTVNQVFIDELTWKVLLGSQVIADESDIIKKLPKQLCENFMKPARNMMPTTLPGRWKESNEKLAEITDEILETSFSPEEAEVLNKGTYLTNLIFPAIRASLKNLHMENSPILARMSVRASLVQIEGNIWKDAPISYL
ncbi:19933_t:CDS:2, partial [Gigaspora rosea]